MILIYVLFDGSNLSTITTKNGRKITFEAKLKAIKQYGWQLKKEIPKVNPIVFVDSPIFHYIDHDNWLRTQINTWEIFKCDKGHEVDEYLLGFLKVLPFQVLIVSHDKFRNHKGKIPKYYEGFKWKFKPKFQGKWSSVPGLKVQLQNLIAQNLSTNITGFQQEIIDKSFISEVY